MSWGRLLQRDTKSNPDRPLGRIGNNETSIFVRALRHVLNRGDPALEHVAVCIKLPSGGSYPIFLLTQTRSNLICWPVLPNCPEVEFTGKKHGLIDHITLGFRSDSSHATMYKNDEDKVYPKEWKIAEVHGGTAKFWFGIAIPTSVIKTQVLEWEASIRMPNRDVERRSDQFLQFFKKKREIHIEIPKSSQAESLIAEFLITAGSIASPVRPIPIELPTHIWSANAVGKLQDCPPGHFNVGLVELALLLQCTDRQLLDNIPYFFTPSHS